MICEAPKQKSRKGIFEICGPGRIRREAPFREPSAKRSQAAIQVGSRAALGNDYRAEAETRAGRGGFSAIAQVGLKKARANRHSRIRVGLPLGCTARPGADCGSFVLVAAMNLGQRG